LEDDQKRRGATIACILTILEDKYRFMNKPEELEKLEEQLQQLSEQLKQQSAQILWLKQQIDSIKGAPARGTSHQSTYHEKKTLENYIGLNIIHLAGIIVLVIGLSLGVKFAIDKNLISVQMRIVLAYSAGMGLLLLSYYLKKNYSLFSAILFSGAAASIYFTTYAAYVYYSMISSGGAFSVMVILTIYTAYQALVYNRQEIALLGLIGAYAIPFLVSRNSDRADLFFSYILLINLAVVFLSIKKEWPLVGRVAEYITWILFIGWASTRFTPAYEGTGILFMLLFFFLFLASIISGKLFYNRKVKQPMIYQVFINNIAVYIAALFVLGGSSRNDSLSGITLTASILVAIEATLFHLFLKEERTKRWLAYYAFILFILFIAFEWKGITVTLLWLLVAVITFVIGVYRKWVALRLTSIVLMGATLFKLVVFDSLTFTTVQKVISYLVLGALLLIISFYYQKFRVQLFSNDQHKL
jgi:uncharacterized membrane protein